MASSPAGASAAADSSSEAGLSRVQVSKFAQPKYSDVMAARQSQRYHESSGAPVFRLGPNVARSVKRFLISRGWKEWDHQALSLQTVSFNSEMIHGPPGGDADADEDNDADEDSRSIKPAEMWNLYWKDSPFTKDLVDSLTGQQRLNHYRNTIAITRKDRLSSNLDMLSQLEYGHVVDVMPRTFRVPKHEQTWKGAFNASSLQHASQLAARAGGGQDEAKDNQAAEPHAETLWIYKPASSRRGKGIFVFSSTPEGWAKYRETRLAVDGKKASGGIVQQYLSNPLLLGGFKFDLRLYVLVTSWWPLKAYIHRRGLVRFSTEPYSLDNLDNATVHLTNSSINKNAPGYKLDKPTIGRGCKWSLDRLWEELAKIRPDIDQQRLWDQIRELALISVLPGVGNVPSDPHCYEILGFDVILDNNGRPWLLEVNRSPAMAQQTAVDRVVKTAVLNGVFQLNGLHQWEKGNYVDVAAHRLNHLRQMTRIEASFASPEQDDADGEDADDGAMVDDNDDSNDSPSAAKADPRLVELEGVRRRTGFDFVFPAPDYHLPSEAHRGFSYHRLQQAALTGEGINLAEQVLLPKSVEEMSRYHNAVLKSVHSRRQKNAKASSSAAGEQQCD